MTIIKGDNNLNIINKIFKLEEKQFYEFCPLFATQWREFKIESNKLIDVLLGKEVCADRFITLLINGYLTIYRRKDGASKIHFSNNRMRDVMRKIINCIFDKYMKESGGHFYLQIDDSAIPELANTPIGDIEIDKITLDKKDQTVFDKLYIIPGFYTNCIGSILCGNYKIKY